MYASMPMSFARQLVLRSYEKVGISTVSQSDVNLTRTRYLDHDTFNHVSGDDNLKIRCYYSGRITISGNLRGYLVDEKLF